MRRRLELAALILFAPAVAQGACTMSASGVAFGVYNPSSSTPTDYSGSVTLNCDKDPHLDGAYQITLSTGGSGSYAGRRMSSGGFNLPYQLYLDAAHSQIWGDGAGGTSVLTGTDKTPKHGGNANYSVYGRIAARLVVNPGAYTDVIIATVTY